MVEFRHTRLISEYDSATGKFINYLELGDTSTDPDTPVDLRFRVPGYIENVHTIYFEGDHGDSFEAGISTSKPSGVVHDLVFFDPQNTSGKTLSELAASGMPSDPAWGDMIYYNGTSWARLVPGTPDTFLQTKGVNANPVWAAGSSGAGLWQDTGTYAELIAAEDITIQSKNITGVNGITMDSEKDGINMNDSPLTNVGGITMSDAINMGGNGISNTYVVKANGTSGVEFRPYDYAAPGDELLNIADNGFAFIAGANASMGGNDLSYVKAINGTTTTPLILNFCGNDPATHEIWREGDDLKFKDATATGTKTLSELATGGGSSTFIGLSDTPTDYTGAASKFVKVNSGADKLEFVAGGSGESLWQDMGTYVQLIQDDDLSMRDKNITNLSAINVTDALEGYDELHIKSQSGTLDIAMFQALSDDSGGLLDMKSHHIINVLAADDVAHAVNLGQLGYVDPSGWVAGDLLYASDSNHLVRLAKGEAAQVLTLSSGVPTWADPSGSGFTCVNLNSCHVTDLTDVSSAGSHNIITDTERTKLNGINTSLYMLLSVYDPGSDGVVIPTAGGTGLGSGLNAYETGDILYASAANILGRRAHGEENQVLTMNSSLLPVWANPSGGTGLWESPAGETYLTTPEPINLQGQDIRDMFNFYMHEGGTWDYLNIYNPAGDKQLIQLMSYGTITASLNLSGADLNMVGNAINGAGEIRAHDTTGIDCLYSGGTNMLSIATSSYSFVANANANMNTHNIINVTEISGVTGQDIYVKPLGDGILYLG